MSANIKTLILTGRQIEKLKDFIVPDGPADPDQMETECIIQRMHFGQVKDHEKFAGFPCPGGLYASFLEYPEEGWLYLGDEA